ncbi:MAG TPA: hypothetical protein DDZ96_11730 [Porphyromonadaceae bacterium]|nr:hypothetical protein [Porphyromonadaceae bacterium]HBL34468.1 hypothetical protein [Porphyromonadaceae bacterium]HBX19678.1 hypothetical protein [Porphyromonadaceae bacterium]HCM21936.1 hypothetical protein [Porphyromonadaceae bacterium]
MKGACWEPVICAWIATGNAAIEEKKQTCMILHYLKITFRDIRKNKIRYLLTTLGLAVGITIFAVMYFLFDVFDYLVGKLPDEKNIFEIRTIVQSNHSPDSKYRDLPFDAALQLVEQDVAEFEYLAFYSYPSEQFCNKANNEKAIFESVVRYVNQDFFSIIGAVFKKGNIEGWGNRQLAVVTESYAKKMFGNENPLGKSIQIRDNVEALDGTYTIAGVIKSIYAQYYQADVFLELDFHPYKDLVAGLVKLKTGVSPQVLNQSLKSVTQNYHVSHPWQGGKNADFYLQISSINDTKLKRSVVIRTLILLLASTVLIVALFNFFILLMSSVQVRIRQFTLRRITGANRWAFFIMFICEMIPVLAGALLVSYVFIELLIKWVLSLPLFPANIIDRGLIDLIYFYPLMVTGGTFLVCLIIALLFMQRIERIVLVQGIRGKLYKAHRNHVRDGLIAFQLIFTLIFSSFALGAFRTVNEAMPDLYRPLLKQQEKAVFQMPVHILKVGIKKEEIVARIRQIPGVEDALLTKEAINYSEAMLSDGRKIWLTRAAIFDGYSRFFELKTPLPLRSLAPDEMIVNKKLADLLIEKGQDDLNTVHGTFKIAGIIQSIPYTEEGDYGAIFPESTIDGTSIGLVKCHPAQAAQIKKEIIQMIREYLPETIPYQISSLYDTIMSDNNLFYNIMVVFGIATLMSLILTLFGIYTAVDSDTERRKKEIAIRKINGATYRDIVWQFVKLYTILLLITLLITLPFDMLFVKTTNLGPNEIKLFSFVNVITTWGIIAIFVFLTIFGMIRRSASKNPAEVIKSE